MTMEALMQKLDAHQDAVKSNHAKTADALAVIDRRLLDTERQLSRSPGPSRTGTEGVKSAGEQFVESDGYKALRDNGGRGTARIEIKAVTSAAGSGGALIVPDRQTEVITGPRLRLQVRNVLAPGTTTSNAIQAALEKVYTNAATPVAETAMKPESNITYEPMVVPVRTIAHWVPVSRQAMDDAPQLQSLIDSGLRYGLDAAEEAQLLLGDGTGENLLGLVPAATDYDTAMNAAGDNSADTILRAITQAEAASQLPVTAIIVNSTDWSDMIGLKGADGHYLSNGPFGQTAPTLWGRPVVETPSMPVGSFLVLNGTQAAQIFDRMETEVLISSEDRDNFVKNMLTVRAEKRLALVLKRPQAIVYGTFPA
jgi:HK97 family phage major capsid protein